MKLTAFPTLLVLLILSTLHLPNSSAQDYTQWRLPEGAKARIGKGSINDIQYSPDGTIFAVAGTVGIWLYDAETYQELVLLTRHTNGVRKIMFSPDSKTLVSIENLAGVVLWDVAARKLKKVLTDDQSYFTITSFSPDGKTLVTTDFKTVHLWDTETGEPKHTLTGHTLRVSSLSFSPEGSTLASGSDDTTIRLWDVTTGAEKKTLMGHTTSISNIAFGPDGGTLMSVSSNRTIHLWDITTGKIKKVLADGGIIRSGGTVQSGSFSAKGGTFASISHNKTIYLWDTATGSLKRALTNAFEMNEQVDEKVVNVSLSANEKTLVIWRRGELIRLWNADTRKYKSLAKKDVGYVGRVALNPDGSTLATENWLGSLHFWDTSTGAHKKTVANQYFPINHDYVIESGHDTTGIALSHKGDKLAAGARDGTIYLWDAISRQQQPLVENFYKSEGGWFSKVLFSPDGKTLASWSFPRYSTMRLWDVATGTHKRTFTGHTSTLTSVSFSPDGRTLATGSRDKTVHLWDVATGTHKETFKTHTAEVTTVSFSPNGKTLVSGGMDKIIRLWDPETGKAKQDFVGHTSGISSIVFSHDGQTLASGGIEGIIHLWDIEAGIQKQTFVGHADDILSLSFSADGLNLASTSIDGTVRLWDTSTGEQKKTLAAYKTTGWRTSFYTDGWALASRFEDEHVHTDWHRSKNVELWDLATGQRLKMLKGHTRKVVSVLFSTDGQTLASADDGGIVLLWDIPSILNTTGDRE